MTWESTATRTLESAYRLGTIASYVGCGKRLSTVSVLFTVGNAIALSDGVGVNVADRTITVRKSEVGEVNVGDQVVMGSEVFVVDRGVDYSEWEWLIDVHKA